MRRFAVVILVAGFSVICLAQNNSSQLDMAVQLFSEGAFEASSEITDSLVNDLHALAPKWHTDLYLLDLRVQRARRKGRAARKAARRLVEHLPNVDNQRTRITCWLEIAHAYAASGRKDQTAQYLDSAVAEISLTEPADPFHQAHISLIRGVFYQKCAFDIDSNLHYYNRATAQFHEAGQPEHLLNAQALRGLGSMCASQSDFEKALSHYDAEYAILQKHYPADHFEIGAVHYNRGNIYYSLTDYEQALQNYLVVYPIWSREMQPSDTYLRFLNEAIGDMYWELGQKDKALGFYDRSLIGEAAQNNDKSEALTAAGDTSLDRQSYDEALAYYQSALKMRIENYGHGHPLTGACNNFVARVYRYRGALDEALELYQQSLRSFVPAFRDSNIYINPSVDSISPGSASFLIETLLAKAEVLYAKYGAADSLLIDLQCAYSTLLLCTEVIDMVRQSPLSESSQLFWSEKAFPVYELAIEIALHLEKVTDQTSYAQEAFELSEKSKAFLLLSAMQQDVYASAHLPAEVYKKEEELTSALREYESKILSEEKRCESVRPKKLDTWKRHLSQLEATYAQHLLRIKSDFPEYYSYRYDVNVINLQEAQKLVSDSSIVVSFFYGSRHIYCFFIYAGEYVTTQVVLDADLNTHFAHFRRGLQNVSVLRSKPDSAYQYVQAGGLAIYQALLAGALANHPQITRAYIVPDGPLSHLPFECLVNDTVLMHSRDYRSLPYLLHKLQISYAPSVTLLAELQSNSNTAQHRSQFLAVAPDYDSSFISRHALQPLTENRAEVLEIGALFDDYQHFTPLSRYAEFQDRAPGSSILHLAMHADLDPGDPSLSRLYFAPDLHAADSGVHYAYELQSFDLNAQLTTLSACNTGAGKWLRGEGVMSLARSFQLAGSPAVAMSLWTVDDLSTRQLMSGFYNNLVNGLSKDRALHHAKLKYLAEADPATSHPFYWAGFVINGNTAPLSLSSKPKYNFWGWGGFLLLILGCIYFYFKR